MDNPATMALTVDEYILMALREDIPGEDVTTAAVLPSYVRGRASLRAKQDGVICGLDVFARVFTLLDPGTSFDFRFSDGDEVRRGDTVCVLTGDMRVLLSGERTALNFLQRMSGIATYTRETARLLEGTGTRLLDTRKTTPNMRVFEKYAVRVGGGKNHRSNLSDGVLIKDNHIGAAGGIRQAVEAARAHAPAVMRIEVEVETAEEAAEAADAGADIIMLDNMTPDGMRRAVEAIGGRALTECSGNVTRENVAVIASCGVDFVSCGALTHSAGILDLSLKDMRPVAEDQRDGR